MAFNPSTHLSSQATKSQEGLTMMLMKWIVGDQGKLTSLWHEAPCTDKGSAIAIVSLKEKAQDLIRVSPVKLAQKSL